jgi:hypothetical protein
VVVAFAVDELVVGAFQPGGFGTGRNLRPICRGIPNGVGERHILEGSGTPAVGTLLATLHDPVTQKKQDFGYEVAVSGNTAIVGRPGAAKSGGIAYLYVKRSSGWPTTPTVTLTDPAGVAHAGFGSSVAVSDQTAVVGAPEGGTGATAYIYVKGPSGRPTHPTATLPNPASTQEDDFGMSVAVSGDTVLVGAPGTKVGTTKEVGAAYIYAV